VPAPNPPSGKVRLIAVPLFVVAAIVAALPGHEGRKFIPYWDAAGKAWTVCAGITGPEVIPGRRYTPAECDTLENRYVVRMLGYMGHCATGEFEFHEVKAWGDFAYNVGTGNFCKSTAVKLLNAGKNKEACNQIPLWHVAGGKDCAIRSNNCYGIVDRRAWQRSLCLGEIN
jgi:lysozyme